MSTKYVLEKFMTVRRHHKSTTTEVGSCPQHPP